jgi:hypothetical protein
MLIHVECRVYILITILAIIRRPVFYFKHVSETRLCLSLQVERTQFDPTVSGDRD